jgi:hypothetical protein
MRKLITAAALVVVLAVVVDRNFFQPYRELRDARKATSQPTGRAGAGYLTVDELARQLDAEERAATQSATLPLAD